MEGTTNRLVTITGPTSCAQTAHLFISRRLEVSTPHRSASLPGLEFNFTLRNVRFPPALPARIGCRSSSGAQCRQTGWFWFRCTFNSPTVRLLLTRTAGFCFRLILWCQDQNARLSILFFSVVETYLLTYLLRWELLICLLSLQRSKWVILKGGD